MPTRKTKESGSTIYHVEEQNLGVTSLYALHPSVAANVLFGCTILETRFFSFSFFKELGVVFYLWMFGHKCLENWVGITNKNSLYYKTTLLCYYKLKCSKTKIQ